MGNRRHHTLASWFDTNVKYMYLALLAVAVASLCVIALDSTKGTSAAGREPREVSFGGQTPSAQSLVLPGAGAPVLVIGDSWSTGYSAQPGNGYVDVLATSTGWAITTDAESGTGFQSTLAGTGSPFPERVADLPEIQPQLVILQGGINDTGSDLDTLTVAAEATITSLQAKYPGVPVVLVGPGSAQWPIPQGIYNVTKKLDAAAQRTGAHFISPARLDWETASNFAEFIDPNTLHPSDAGHKIFADRLADALRERAGQ